MTTRLPVRPPLPTVCTLLLVLSSMLAGRESSAVDLGEIWQKLTGPLHTAGPIAPRADPAMIELATRLDWLERHLDTYGSVVVKHPDVWGQSRLLRHRHEYEQQLQAQLDQFAYRSNAALRRSDQTYLGMALALEAASGRRRGAEVVPLPSAGGSASVVNQIQSLLPSGNETVGRGETAIIGRAQPLAFPENPPGFRFEEGPLSLEPTLHLDQLSRYLNHLHELRRINEGDDVADAPGYAMVLVRLPISILPGGRTRRGYGAEATLIAEPILDDHLLPRTFRTLVINDLVDLIAPALAWCVNDASCVQWAGELSATALDASQRSFAITALAERLPTASPASPPAAQTRRSRMPIPFTQLVEASGVEQIAGLISATHTALVGLPTSRPCIGYGDVRGFLEEELNAAYDLLALPEMAGLWLELPSWQLAGLIRGRRGDEIDHLRNRFFADLDAHSGVAGRAISHTTTAVLAWGILVESVLLDAQLSEDMQHTACRHEMSVETGPFFGPFPPPLARQAFHQYVQTRWPLHVFALDPVVQEQNIEDSYSRRRELQIAMAMAFASGRMNAAALTRYTRRLETDMATVALNRTVVGFSHGSDTFGWRFTPRLQSPPDRGTLAAFTETLCGPSADADLAQSQLEPGMRECTAILVIPSFVSGVTFDVRTNWFSLTHPRCTEPSLAEAVTSAEMIAAVRAAPADDPRLTCSLPNTALRPLLRRAEQLDRELPLQTLSAQLPYENTAGGFELFSQGTTALAPELLGWYGAPGIDPSRNTSLYLIGRGFSVHDTSLLAGGRPVPITLISREVLRADIPPGVASLSAVSRPPLPHPTPPAAVEELPPPGGEAVSRGALSTGDCNRREVVDLHLATPYGVTSHLLVPVIRASESDAEMAFADRYEISLAYTTGKSSTANAEVARIDEFYGAAFNTLAITVPEAFLPPAKGVLNFTLSDPATRTPAAVFAIPLPSFDTARQAYALSGAELRNFIGDTSRPATDKTLRGALKPYLDSQLAAGTAPAVGQSLPLQLTATLAAEGRELPVSGAVQVVAQRR